MRSSEALTAVVLVVLACLRTDDAEAQQDAEQSVQIAAMRQRIQP